MNLHPHIQKCLQPDSKKHFVRKMRLGLIMSAVVLSATFALGLGSGNAHAHPANACHTVQAGETLSGIAAQMGTDWSSLAAANGLADPNFLSIGQQICMSGSAPAQQAAPANNGGDGSVTGMIYQVFGGYAPAAISVAQCESGLNPGATNPQSVGGSNAAGVFQILYPSTWYGTSQAGASPYNAYANIVAAHDIFVRDGYSWREWSCQP